MWIRFYTGTMLLALVLALAPAAHAQNNDDNRNNNRRGDRAGTVTPRGMDTGDKQYDVVLDVPNLSVEQIKLEVDNLEARLSLDARVANLVQLRAGADVSINRVVLEISGVQAEAHLRVSLDNVAAIVNRTLETLENNPEIIETLGQTLQQTVGTVGDVAGQALGPGGAVSQTLQTLSPALQNVTRPGGLLSQTVNTLGQTVYKTVDETGNLVESTVGQAGQLVGSTNLGSVTDLGNVLTETTNAAGQTIRQVQDQAGNVLEYTLDNTGKVTNARVVKQATSQVPGSRNR